MRNRTLLCLMLTLALCTTSAMARKGKDGVDDIVGSIWTYTLKKGDKEESGQFRIYKGEVFKGADKVGTYHVKDEDETTITFTNWPEMNGTAVLRKTHKRPPGAAGVLHKKDGTDWEMKAHWKDG